MSTQQQAERLKVAKPDLLDLPPELFRMIIEQVVVCLSFVCKDLRSYIDNNDTLSHKMFRMTLAESAMDDDEQLEWFEDLWPDEIYESVYKQVYFNHSSCA